MNEYITLTIQFDNITNKFSSFSEVINDKLTVDSVEKIINNNPYTIVRWKDGTATIVKCQEGDVYNFEGGIARCFMKKACGNTGEYNKIFHKFCNKRYL